MFENDRSKKKEKKNEKKIAKKLQKNCKKKMFGRVGFVGFKWTTTKEATERFSKVNLEFIHMMLSSGCEEANIWVWFFSATLWKVNFTLLLKINRWLKSYILNSESSVNFSYGIFELKV